MAETQCVGFSEVGNGVDVSTCALVDTVELHRPERPERPVGFGGVAPICRRQRAWLGRGQHGSANPVGVRAESELVLLGHDEHLVECCRRQRWQISGKHSDRFVGMVSVAQARPRSIAAFRPSSVADDFSYTM